MAKEAALPARTVAPPPTAPTPTVAVAQAAATRATTRTPVETTRPPVPLLLSARSPQGSQRSEEARPAEATPDNTAVAQTDKSVTEQTDKKVSSDAAAKAMIEADGYKNVRSVAKAPDGSWRGFAMRGTVEVAISVDGSGNVSTQ